MADENVTQGASTSEVTGDGSESTVELNIKTLDSQIYTLRVDKNMPVPLFKEKIANTIGVPVEQQRLIFRGKVLKDDHSLSEYHVEDGHTLHLVARQPVQSQALPGTSSGETSGINDNRGNDASAGAPRNRVAQASHSVVLGTFNVGDQSEGIVPDITRIIGAVLNSIGIGNQTTTGGLSNVPSIVTSNASSQTSQGVETEGMRGNVGGRSQAGNQAQPVQTFPSHLFQSLPQSVQFPMTGTSVPVPSLHAPIPDSLSTLSEFINRLELALSVNGSQPPSPADVGDSPRVELPSNSQGLPTPEALSFVMRRAQQLLSGHAAAALSHIAGRLEGEGASTDPEVRRQIQTESAQVGLAMQHLGALFLELGRTILTLRMGQSPAESLVNAGPAIYISPSGPNPIMVQPFSPQTSSLFGGASAAPQTTFGTSGPNGLGDVTRNISIHIHAGTTLAPGLSLVGSRANTGEGTHGEHGTGSVDSGPPPVRNVIAAAVPSRSSAEAGSHFLSALYPLHARSQQTNPSHSIPAQGSGVAVSNTGQPGMGVSVLQSPSEPVSLPTVIAEVNTHIRNLVNNMQGENQGPSGQSDASTVQDSSVGFGVGINGTGETTVSLPDRVSEREGQQFNDNEDTRGSLKSKEASSTNSVGSSSNCASEETILSGKSDVASEDTLRSSQSHDPPEDAKTVPLGLGLGGLQPRRRSKQVKSQGKTGDGTSRSPPVSLNQSTIASGQQVLQSFLSRGTNANRTDATGIPSEQLFPLAGQIMEETMQLGGQGSNGQFDAASMMSQVLNNPTLNDLLAGVSEQAGVGSPAGFRNMLEQFTQSPAMRNTINQIAQQVQDQDIGGMLSGMGRGQGGGLDFSRIVQNMMPIVSQALTRGSAHTEPFSSAESEQQPHSNERRPDIDDKSDDWNSQINLQQASQRIEHHDPPRDIFRTVVENAARLYGDGTVSEDLIEALCSDEGLANEFTEMLQRNLRQRLQEDS